MDPDRSSFEFNNDITNIGDTTIHKQHQEHMIDDDIIDPKPPFEIFSGKLWFTMI